MKISASIYSNKNKDKSLSDIISELDKHYIDLYHVDCMDDLAVFDDIKLIKSMSDTPVDLHIITSEPEKFYAPIEECGVDYVTFQYENLKAPIDIPDAIRSKMGLAIVSDTSIEVFDDFADDFDFILFMTTTPGKSGGTFEKSNFRKVREFQKKHPSKRIHVDGGVNHEVSFILRNMGVFAAVSGSYLLNSEYFGAALLQLKTHEINSHFVVGDFMENQDEVPVIKQEELTFENAIKAIDEYNEGFVMIAGEDNKLAGIISNADLRKGIIRHLGNLDNIPAEDMINPTPVVINKDKTIGDLLKLVKDSSFPILFLPVVDDENRIAGAVSFNNLIKGES